MNKIDKKLQNFIILGQNDCILDAIVYYNDKKKAKSFFAHNNINVIKELNFINAFVVCFNPQNILFASKQNFIAYISSISTVETFIDISKKIVGVNKFYKCEETITFIDTGISPHFDFTLAKNRIIKFVDFVANKTVAYDDNGHGTFVAGVASGRGLLSNQKFCGIVPNSKIISLKALNKHGEANAVTILEAMEWVLNYKNKYNINTVCMSFGSEPLGISDPIVKGAEALWDKGVTIVCAAGNSGPNPQTIKSPAVSKKVITVGCLDDCRNSNRDLNIHNFKIAEFSSRGPAFGKIKPDIVAPGVDITSCDKDGTYKKMSGTSVATPIVAGLCAIIKNKYPHATPEQIKKFLLASAIPLGLSKNEQGHGIANIFNL